MLHHSRLVLGAIEFPKSQDKPTVMEKYRTSFPTYIMDYRKVYGCTVIHAPKYSLQTEIHHHAKVASSTFRRSALRHYQITAIHTAVITTTLAISFLFALFDNPSSHYTP